MKVGFPVPGKKWPLMSCAFSQPRWGWILPSLRDSAWEGRTIEAHRAQIREMAILSLHLIQVSLALVNTLLLQEVLAEDKWKAPRSQKSGVG